MGAERCRTSSAKLTEAQEWKDLFSAKSSRCWVFASFSRRYFFEPIFVVQAVENRVPYHSLATRNSVT